MITISLCMIVKNEEKVIARCLESIKSAVDEIIVVDTGSTDETINILKKYPVQIEHFQWIDDFAAARNYAFSKATQDYIMWMDADDIINEIDLAKLISLKENLSSDINVIMMKYNVSFDADNNPLVSFYRERIVKRECNFQWVGEIHETIENHGARIYQDIAIEHHRMERIDTARNLRIFKKKIANGKKLSPREMFYYARELYYNAKYQEAIKNFKIFLDSKDGWVENKISACRDLADCYYQINQERNALKALLESFQFDNPRAEICCDIGKHFVQKQNWSQAKYWYIIALSTTPNLQSGGFLDMDCYTFIPLMQLTMICCQLKEIKLALHYHNKVRKIRPNNPSVIYNEDFFNKIKTE